MRNTRDSLTSGAQLGAVGFQGRLVLEDQTLRTKWPLLQDQECLLKVTHHRLNRRTLSAGSQVGVAHLQAQ